MALPYNMGRTVIAAPTIDSYNFSGSWKAWANKYTSVEAGAVTTAFFYSKGALAACNVRVAVYAADGAAGIPGTRLGTSGAIACPLTTAGWLSVSWAGPTIAAATAYWVVVIAEDGNAATNYFGDTNMDRHAVGSYPTGPSPWGASESGGTGSLSAYVVVDAAVPTPSSGGPGSGRASAGASQVTSAGYYF